MTTTRPFPSSSRMRSPSTDWIRAWVWEPSVIIPACCPVKEIEGTPSSATAMARSAVEMISPAWRSMSISRRSGWNVISRERLMRESVVFPMAETTTTTGRPSRLRAATLRATFFMCWDVATEEPPYFWTRMSFPRTLPDGFRVIGERHPEVIGGQDPVLRGDVPLPELLDTDLAEPDPLARREGGDRGPRPADEGPEARAVLVQGADDPPHRREEREAPALVDLVPHPVDEEVLSVEEETREEEAQPLEVEDRLGARDREGQDLARLPGRELPLGDDDDHLEAVGHAQARRDHLLVDGRAHGEPSEDARGNVVRMPFHVSGGIEDGRPLGRRSPDDPLAERDPGHGGRRARAESARERDPVPDPQAEVPRHRIARVLEHHAVDEIRAVRGDVLRAEPLGLDDEPRVAGGRLDLEVHLEREPHHVEPRAEVRGGGRHAHLHGPVLVPHEESSFPSASRLASTTRGGVEDRIARSGSLSPWPVSVHTMVPSSRTSPSLTVRMSPATDAAEAGSAKTPSRDAMSLYALTISSSVTMAIRPPDSSLARTAPSQLAGFPIRMAVARVSGSFTGAPRTMGAAPSAWNPIMRGRLAMRPRA